MSTAGGAGVLAHGLHYGAVLAGLMGLAALLLPHALEPLRPHRAAPRDEHELRILNLRQAVVAGSLGTPEAVLLLSGPRSVRLPRIRTDVAALALPLAVVGSAAAAGAHAAVGPPYLAESALFGTFFIVAACAQAGWAMLMLRRASRALVVAGTVGNLAVLALWLTTRVAGLPFGLMPEPHPVGAWDLTIAVWEVAVVLGCAAALRDGTPRRIAGWFEWHPAAQAALVGSVFTLVTLTLVGGHA
jgi:hypothetical protein